MKTNLVFFVWLATVGSCLSLPPPRVGDSLPSLTPPLYADRFWHPRKGELVEVSVKRPDGITAPNSTFTTTVKLVVQTATIRDPCRPVSASDLYWEDVPAQNEFRGYDEVMSVVKADSQKSYLFRVRTSSSWPGNNFSPWLTLENVSLPLQGAASLCGRPVSSESDDSTSTVTTSQRMTTTTLAPSSRTANNQFPFLWTQR